MRSYLRSAVSLGTGLTGLLLLVRCTVQERDYADLNIGNAGRGGGSGSAGSVGTGGDGSDDGNGGADDSDAGLPDDAGQDSGASGSGSAGTGGTGGGTGGSGGGGTGGSSGTLECGAAEVCVPVVPSGWTGPIVVSNASGASSCPGGYAQVLGNVNAGLNATAPNCGCGCVSNVDCFIGSGNTGGRLEPVGECDSPPTNDDCLSAQLITSCTPSGSQTISPITWATTRLTCGGADANDSCTGGSCFPSGSGFGPVCISQNGDVACPSAFSNRNLFFRNVTDTRSCSVCGCYTQGHSCEIDIEVCSVGDYPLTLSTDLGNEECLNSSDGDDLTLVSTSITGGSCSTTGGAAQGSAVPSNPVTVCCL